MIRVVFVCHGNICRSPMGEFIFKDMVKKRGIEDRFEIWSVAASREELGNPVYPPAARRLKQAGIDCKGHCARQIAKNDYEKADYILAAESWNIRNIERVIGEDKDRKIFRLLDFSKKPRDIADPWYTNNFDTAFKDIFEGCESFLEYLGKRKMI